MAKYSNFDVYKVSCPAVSGYVFAVLEETDEEPVYHYYLIANNSKQYPPISKPTDIMAILQAEDGNLEEVNGNIEEFTQFIKTMESLLLKPLLPFVKNKLYSTITQRDIQLLRKTN